MGLTFQSTQNSALSDIFHIDKKEGQYVIALAGNPNTGKSTVFNSLTGLHQHTGNWPGKTVVNARGSFNHLDKEFILVDLPGTYSLFSSSVEEEVARDFICFGNSDAVIVVTDGTCLERNLNLVFQIMELRDQVVLCINLIDEAKKKKIEIDAKGLEMELGLPVVLCAARNDIGIDDLKATIYNLITHKISSNPKTLYYEKEIEEAIIRLRPLLEKYNDNINTRWLALRMLDGDRKLIESLREIISGDDMEEISSILNGIDICKDKQSIRDSIASTIYNKAQEVTDKYVKSNPKKINRDRIIDNYVTSKKFGIPLMLLTLAIILWITISGANYPSALLSDLFFRLEIRLTMLFNQINSPGWLYGLVVLGIYRTLSWVISVMLPPMAIFFPLFTILEDLGYLPRVAFNMDHYFKKACAHGKQCLTMCMGFGCNAAGIIACRIIDSPREKLIATITNNFVPCNGRFPTLIAISTIFLVTKEGFAYGFLPVLTVTGLIVLGIAITLLVSYLLSKTLLRGVPSTFTLELPPYRIPKVGRVLYTSLIDRTLFVLWRAVIVAAPAGAITWILGNVYIDNMSIIGHVATFLDPAANLIGLDGFILMAFILGLPANEIVLPILLMSYLSTGAMVELNNLDSLKSILLDNGWTYLTALNTMLFCLLHWPCATTLITIKKETNSFKWTALSAIIPTGVGIVLCMFTTLIFRLLGWG